MPTPPLVTTLRGGNLSIGFEALCSKSAVGESHQARSNDEFDVERADVQLANRESELRDCAMQFMTQGVTITDPTLPDNPIIYASPGFLRLTGYELEDVLGKNCRFLVGPSTDPIARAQIRDAVRDGRPLQVVLCNYRKDGTKFWNELSITPLRDAAGNINKLVALQSDVTQRQHVEDQQRQSHTMELIGQLAGGVAHDFNNLLTVILTYSDLLLRSPSPEMRGVDSLLEISEAGQRAASLTRQLLAFSQNRPLALEVVNINTIIQHLESMLRRLISDDIEISIVLQTDLEDVLADPRQLAQVVLDLALQARDAMPRGGKLIVETRNMELFEDQTIADHSVVPGVYVVLKVENNGPGILGEKVPTSRSSPLNSDRIPQSISASDHLISAAETVVTGYHGYLQVDSKPGVGTSVTVYLPSAVRVAETTPLPSIRDSLPCGTEHILLVENDEAVRALSQHMLQKCGYIVYSARDAASALAIAQDCQTPIHLLFTDFVLPGAGGGWLAKQVRITRPAMKVIFSSGCIYEDMVGHSVDQNQVNFLAKPFRAYELANKVREVLDEP